MKLEKKARLKDEFVYIRYLTNVYQAHYMNEDCWLRKREKDFFLITVYMVRNGVNEWGSRELFEAYRDYGNFSISGKATNIINLKRSLKK